MDTLNEDLSFYNYANLIEVPTLVVEKVENQYQIIFVNRSLQGCFHVDNRTLIGITWQESVDSEMNLADIPFLYDENSRKQFISLIQTAFHTLQNSHQYILFRDFPTTKEENPFMWRVNTHIFNSKCLCLLRRFEEDLPPSARIKRKSEDYIDLQVLDNQIQKNKMDIVENLHEESSEHRKRRKSSVEHQEIVKGFVPQVMINLIETIPHMLWTGNADGWIDYYNNKWIDYTGLSIEETQGWGWGQVLHPDDLQRSLDTWRNSVATGQKYEIEYRFKRARDGAYRWHLGLALPMRDHKGDIIKWFGTCTDIDDQKRAEFERQQALDALKKSEGHFRRLFEANIIGIAFTNVRGIIFDVNQAFVDTLGYTKEDIFSGRIGWRNILHQEDLSTLLKFCRDEQKMFTREQEYITRLGTTVSVLVGYANLERDTITFVMDITERKKAETVALEAVKTKSFFIANISHEIRTPMSGIIGMTDILLDTQLTEQQQDYAQTIKRSAEELLTLINDILDFSKIEAGKVDLQEVDFNVLNAIEDVINLLGEAANLKGVDLLYSVSDVFRELTVNGDSGRFRQILINLLGNAIKFTDKGEIVIRTSILSNQHCGQQRSGSNSFMLKVEVKDTGIGISKERIIDLFKPFSQIDNTATRKYAGTGLGLAICKQLVKILGGDLGLESELGKGTTFWFTVRLKVGVTAPLVSNTPFTQRKPRVTVILPSESARAILSDYFNSWEIRNIMVDRNQFLTNKEALQCDVILTLASYAADVVRVVEKNQLTERPKLVVIGHPLELKELDVPIDGFLTKPLRQSKLLETLLKTTADNPLVLRLRASESPNENMKSSPALSSKTAQPKKSHRYCVLLVEDNPVNQMVAVRQLDKLGYRAVVAENGQQALELHEESPFPLILMDLQMPVMDGITCTKEIRNKEKIQGKKPVPIIAMTANAMSSSIEQCLGAGMTDYVTKPVKIELLQTVLKKWHQVS